MKKVNPLGLLGLVGFFGLVGVFGGSSASLAYFSYFGYFFYFSEPFTEELKNQTLRAMALAYLFSFLANLTFIAIANAGGSIDYRSGFYISYTTGGFTFPLASIGLKIYSWIKKKRAASPGSIKPEERT